MKRLKVSRMLYWAVCEEFSDRPLPSRSDKGRFHDSTTKDVTTYLAERAHTAGCRVTHRWHANEEAYRTAEVRVLLHQVVDPTDPAIQGHYGVDQTTLTADDYVACQRRLAHRLRAEGVEALWIYSSPIHEGCRNRSLRCGTTMQPSHRMHDLEDRYRHGVEAHLAHFADGMGM